VVARRPPNTIAEIGTPCGSSTWRDRLGLLRAGAVNRELGWAAFSSEWSVHGLPFQSVSSAGTGPSMPSHHGWPSGVMATLVNRVSRWTVCIALGFERMLVPGATPK
jgi:hypothetical protein